MSSSHVRSFVRSNAMGIIALFVALGGTAYAVDGPNPGQNTIGSEDIIGNEVKSDDIGNGRIFNIDIADEIITGQKIKDGSLDGDDILGLGFNTNNAFQGNSSQDCILSDIYLTAGSRIPNNRAPASGQVLSIAQNTALFSLLGTTYGGNGQTTFALPDLRDVAPDRMTYSICMAGIFPG